MSNSTLEISKACDQVKEMLLSKNMKYGDSALDPVRVFSKASPVEQLLVRIDDKISRIQRGVGLVASDEDVIDDLIGYLVLLKIALGRQDQKKDPNFQLDSSIYDDILNFHSPIAGQFSSDVVSFPQWDGTDIDNPKEFYFSNFAAGCPD